MTQPVSDGDLARMAEELSVICDKLASDNAALTAANAQFEARVERLERARLEANVQVANMRVDKLMAERATLVARLELLEVCIRACKTHPVNPTPCPSTVEDAAPHSAAVTPPQAVASPQPAAVATPQDAAVTPPQDSAWAAIIEAGLVIPEDVALTPQLVARLRLPKMRD